MKNRVSELLPLGVAFATAGCQLFPAFLAGVPAPGPSAQAAAAPAIRFAATLEGTVSGPARLLGNTGSALIGNTGAALIGSTGSALGGTSGGYRVADIETAPAAGAIVYLSSPDEDLYRDPSGKVVSTIADARGRYVLPADVGMPLIVTAVLPHNRRLVGYTLLTREGSASLDVSLQSTYVTEFLRYEARKRKKTMADHDVSKLPRIVELTRAMIASGDLPEDPDISIASIPSLVQAYLVAFATRNRALSDAWADLLGSRPLAVTTVPHGSGPSFRAAAVETAGDRIWVSTFNDSGVEIRGIGDAEPVFKGSGYQGFMVVQAMDVGPDGKLYFVERDDRRRGGILLSSDRTKIRLFAFNPVTAELEEHRLPVLPELAGYVADPDVESAVEASSLVWHGGRLYLADRASGLIYRYWREGSGPWQGALFAGRIENGRPLAGYEGGDRLTQARFRVPWHLAWHGSDLFVASPADAVIRRLGEDGLLGVALGTPGRRGSSPDGTPAGEALLDFPSATAFDAAGRMWVADRDNHRIVRVDGGALKVAAGGSGSLASDGDASAIALGEVGSLAFEPGGNLLFTDLGTGRVLRLWLEFGP